MSRHRPARDPEAALAALGDASRQQIIAILRGGPRSVAEIAAELPVSRPAVSKHLKLLKDAGLVTSQERGTRRIYGLDPEGFALVRDQLDRIWDDALRRSLCSLTTRRPRSPVGPRAPNPRKGRSDDASIRKPLAGRQDDRASLFARARIRSVRPPHYGVVADRHAQRGARPSTARTIRSSGRRTIIRNARLR